MSYLLARLREPGIHTGVAMLTTILLLTQLTGLDLTQLTSSATGVATALGTLAAAAKVVLPDPKP